MLQRVFTWGDVDAAFAAADHVFTEQFRWHRLGANPLETFGVISQWDLVDGSLTCHGSFQSQFHMGARARGWCSGCRRNKVRMVSQPHGGSFGGKGGARGTDITALLSRKSGGRPVKWIEDRMEYLAGGASQAWDRHYEVVARARRRDGTVTGLRVKLLDDLGATAEGWGAVSAAKPLAAFTGCYAIPAAQYDLTIVATNKLPGSPYRGMGPPPHNLVLEQMMDIAARKLGLDPGRDPPAELHPEGRVPVHDRERQRVRQRRLRGRARRPCSRWATTSAPRRAGRGARRRAAISASASSTRSSPASSTGTPTRSSASPAPACPRARRSRSTCSARSSSRSASRSKGRASTRSRRRCSPTTSASSIADVRVVPQDTLSAPPHFGPGGSRLGVALTGAVLGAADRLRQKLVAVAARALADARPRHVELMDGKLRIKGVPSAEMPLAQVAASMLARSDLLPPGIDPNPEATYVWTAPGRTPADDQGRAKSYLTAANACHLVLVEVDVETGQGRDPPYWIADDCGTRLNPATVEGMIQGGVAQGVGAALLEEYVYDDDGQLLTSTFMDYLLPSVYEVPMTEKTRALHAVAVHAARRQGRAARARCTRRPPRSCARSTTRSRRSACARPRCRRARTACGSCLSNARPTRRSP